MSKDKEINPELASILRGVIDPELHENIVDLGMVQSASIDADGLAQITVALTTAGCPLRNQIKTDVQRKVATMPGVENVKVSFGVLDAEQKRTLMDTARKNARDNAADTAVSATTRVIAVASGKGGVGKSTITANLAVTLAKMGFKVGVLDADIYGPSMPIMFDVENSKPISVEVDGKSKMQPVASYGVEILSIGFFTKPDQAVIWRGPMAAKALNQMIFDANWGELDFMLIDLPPGTGDIHLSIMQSLPITGAVVVSTPQAVALADAKKGVSMFMSESINVPVLGIIENMAYFTPEELPENKYYIFGKEGAKNLAEDLQVPLLGEVPLVQSIREAGDYGRPAALQTASVLEGVFENITRNVVQETVNRNETLPPTEAIKITTMAGCSAVKK